MRARTLARRGQPVPGLAHRRSSRSGIVLLVVAVASPLAAVGEEELFSFHMAQHLLLGDLAPLCLLAGLDRAAAPPASSRFPGVMRLRVLANPFVALPIWAANLALWHVPAVYEAAVESSGVHALEHIAFFSAGDRPLAPGARDTAGARVVRHRRQARVHRRRPARRARCIGNVFIWAEPFYDIYESGDDYLGLSPQADQSLAGSLMMLEGSLVTIVAIAWLFLRMAQEGQVRQELLERGHDPRTVRRAVRYRRWQSSKQHAMTRPTGSTTSSWWSRRASVAQPRAEARPERSRSGASRPSAARASGSRA